MSTSTNLSSNINENDVNAEPVQSPGILDPEYAHDIPDDENDPVFDAFEELEKQCEQMDISPEQAFMLYATNLFHYEEAVNAINKIMANLEPGDIMKMIETMKVVHGFKEEAKESPKIPEKKKNKTLIKIKKGLQNHEIQAYLKEINTALKDRPDVVDLYCPDWANENTHYAMLPACKKLLVKYCEAGLLGCLITHDYQKVAHELYCCAYVKGKLEGDKIKFQQVDINDYKIKTMESVKTFWTLIDADSKTT